MQVNQKYEPVVMMDTSSIVVGDQPMPQSSYESLCALESSIVRFGIKNPIRISADGKVIDGRTRLHFAQKYKLPVVPCIISENPLEEALKYDMELGRRHLTEDEHKSLSKQAEKFDADLIKSTMANYMKSISEYLHPSVKRIFERTEDIRFIREISMQTKEVQEQLVVEVEINQGKKQLNEQAMLLKDLQEQSRQYKESIDKATSVHKTLKKRYDEEAKVLKALRDDFQNNLNLAIKQKKEELEAQFKEKSDLLDSKAPEKLKELLKKESEKIRNTYADRLEEANQNLEDYKEDLNKRANEIEELRTAKQNLVEEKKKAEQDVGAIRKELLSKSTRFAAYMNTGKFANRIKSIQIDFSNQYSSFIDTMDVISDQFTTNEVALILDSIEKIAATLPAIQDAFSVLAKKRGLKKKVKTATAA